MKTMLALELRRNRAAFYSAAAMFLLSLPAAVIYAKSCRPPMAVHEAMLALMYFWAVPGSLMACALFGAYGGMQLGSEAAQPAEEVLPVRPWKRAAAGLFSALFYGALFSVLAWAAFSLTGPASLGGDGKFLPFALLFCSVLFYSLTFSFGSGGGGAVAGFAMAGAMFGLFIFARKVIAWTFGYGAGLPLLVAAVYLLAVGGAIAMLFIRAETAALRPGRPVMKNMAAAACGLAGLALGLVSARVGLTHNLESLVPLDSARGSMLMSYQLRKAPPDEGILAASMNGKLALVRPDGSMTDLTPATADGFRPKVVDAGYGPDGGLWILASNGLREEGWQYRIWSAEKGAPGKLLASFFSPERKPQVILFNTLGKAVSPAGGLVVMSDSGGTTYVADIADGKKLAWRPLAKEEQMAMVAGVVKAGFPDKGGAAALYAVRKDDGMLYFPAGGQELGPVNPAALEKYLGANWRPADWKMEPLAVVRVRPPQVDLVIARKNLVTLDASSGRIVAERAMPSTGMSGGSFRESIYPRSSGFFYSFGTYIYFIGWDGKAVRMPRSV